MNKLNIIKLLIGVFFILNLVISYAESSIRQNVVLTLTGGVSSPIFNDSKNTAKQSLLPTNYLIGLGFTTKTFDAKVPFYFGGDIDLSNGKIINNTKKGKNSLTDSNIYGGTYLKNTSGDIELFLRFGIGSRVQKIKYYSGLNDNEVYNTRRANIVERDSQSYKYLPIGFSLAFKVNDNLSIVPDYEYDFIISAKRTLDFAPSKFQTCEGSITTKQGSGSGQKIKLSFKYDNFIVSPYYISFKSEDDYTQNLSCTSKYSNIGGGNYRGGSIPTAAKQNKGGGKVSGIAPQTIYESMPYPSKNKFEEYGLKFTYVF